MEQTVVIGNLFFTVEEIIAMQHHMPHGHANSEHQDQVLKSIQYKLTKVMENVPDASGPSNSK